MTRHVYPADTITIINNSGSAGYATPSSGTIEAALSAAGGAAVECGAPFNSNSSAKVNFEFTSTLLPAINTSRKQSRFLRCVVVITSGDANLDITTSMRFQCGSNTYVSTNTRPGNYSFPHSFAFQYPINGSNGGTEYWQGDPTVVKFTISGLRSGISPNAAQLRIDHVRFEYGEADDYMDVDMATGANRDVGLGGNAWTSPTLCKAPDTDGATHSVTNASPSWSLDRTYSSFSLPTGATYQGLEVWDGVTMASAGGGGSKWTMNFAHWPLSADPSTTPTNQFVWDLNDVDPFARPTTPPFSYSPAGGGSTSANGYMVWGGGPGDNFTDALYNDVKNGWTGLTESRLKSAGYSPTMVVSMPSGSPSTKLNRVFLRVFYDNPPVTEAPLLLCEA